MKKTPQRKILVLLDGPDIRHEVLRYSVELAARTGAAIVFLMLLRHVYVSGGEQPESQERTMNTSVREAGKRALNNCVRETGLCGIESEAVLRQGDPASELLKFLAASRPCQTVVWGGNEAFVRGRRTPVRGHWLERVREELDCALVVPALKGKRA